jgi:hypothetical protein
MITHVTLVPGDVVFSGRKFSVCSSRPLTLDEANRYGPYLLYRSCLCVHPILYRRQEHIGLRMGANLVAVDVTRQDLSENGLAFHMT